MNCLVTDNWQIHLYGTNIRNSFWYNLKPICFNYRLRIICLVPTIPFTDPLLCSLRLSFTHDWLTIENWTKLYWTIFITLVLNFGKIQLHLSLIPGWRVSDQNFRKLDDISFSLGWYFGCSYCAFCSPGYLVRSLQCNKIFLSKCSALFKLYF